MLQIYNSITKQKELFRPLEEGKVKLYVCGMTVYDFCHMGNARSFVVFDMVVRYLRVIGYDVLYVRNITDIDDKIIKRARENNESFESLTERFTDNLHVDLQKLGLIAPDIEPKATGHMVQIITMIEILIAKEHAYVAENGDVYFDTRSFADYGILAQQDLDEMRSGARVAVSDAKRDPLDFVLWKAAKEDEPSWDSPWGKGRPGWHIECSAMSTEYLGPQFDIHGGGADLQFPHHQNEVAQAQACGYKFANYWMHVGFLQINKKKMSKSLGNFFTLREVLKEYNPEVVHYFLLANHYRSPLDYAKDNLDVAYRALERLYIAMRDLPDVHVEKDTAFEKRFYAAMDDDFNVPEALAVLFDMARSINKLKAENALAEAAQVAALLRQLANILGLLTQTPEEFLQSDEDTSAIEALIAERQQARADKNWALADQVREKLDVLGVELEDGQHGTTWRKK
ncbi:MAG: cysteine--tRNA ligase [Gammaproteobacteria bacterium]|nr:cysteine--tRNA ligase [Gammaproteobacteria bacterium]